MKELSDSGIFSVFLHIPGNFFQNLSDDKLRY